MTMFNHTDQKTLRNIALLAAALVVLILTLTVTAKKTSDIDSTRLETAHDMR